GLLPGGVNTAQTPRTQSFAIKTCSNGLGSKSLIVVKEIRATALATSTEVAVTPEVRCGWPAASENSVSGTQLVHFGVTPNGPDEWTAASFGETAQYAEFFPRIEPYR